MGGRRLKIKHLAIDEDTHAELMKRLDGQSVANALRRMMGLPLLPKNWRSKEFKAKTDPE